MKLFARFSILDLYGGKRKNIIKILTFVFFFFSPALVFSYDFHSGAETMFSRHFNDPAADSYFTKRKWGEFFLPLK